MKKQNLMAYISFDKFWRSEFHNDIPAKDRVQDINLNQLKIKVNDTYEKNEKITTVFESSNAHDVINKAHLDTKLPKLEGHLSLKQTD